MSQARAKSSRDTTTRGGTLKNKFPLYWVQEGLECPSLPRAGFSTTRREGGGAPRLARPAAWPSDRHDPSVRLEVPIPLCVDPPAPACVQERHMCSSLPRARKKIKLKKKKEVSSLRQDESSKRGDESQQIAAWQLLYRVQHPARYLSRLQTIPSSDIEQTYPWSTVWGGTTISQVPSPAAVPLRPARQTRALVGPPDTQWAALGRQITLSGASRLSELPQFIVASTRRDTALEAFRHNPTDGSLAPPAPRPSA